MSLRLFWNIQTCGLIYFKSVWNIKDIRKIKKVLDNNLRKQWVNVATSLSRKQLINYSSGTPRTNEHDWQENIQLVTLKAFEYKELRRQQFKGDKENTQTSFSFQKTN